jgi:hypothetical protein
MADGQEIAAGTDPNSAASVFKLLSAAVDLDGAVSLRWLSVSNKLYTVQRAGGLRAGAFTNLAENIPATPPENYYLDATATNASQLFYRIKVE